MKKVYLYLLLVLMGSLGFACTIPAQNTPGIGITEPSSTRIETNQVQIETPLPTSQVSVSLVPNPTPSIVAGDQAFWEGDWEQALQAYTFALENSSEPEVKSAALLGLGRTRYKMGDYIGVLNALRPVVEEYPNTVVLADAYFEMAQTYSALNRYQEAADAYASYLSLNPGVIDSYIYEWKADSLMADGNYSSAILDYQKAIAAPRVGESLSIQVKIGKAYAALGDYTTAIVAYTDVFSRTTNDYIKAQTDYLLGQAYIPLGQTQSAYEHYLNAVENYPLAYDSYISLINLVEAGYPVSEFDRGLVDYFANQYSLSIAAFDRYLTNNTEKADIAIYYKGLAFLSLGDPQSAIDVWNELLELNPESDIIDKVIEEKVYVLWAYFDDYDNASQILLDFVESNPWHQRAPEFLYMAARIQERGGRLDRAAEIWGRVAPEYPTSEYANPAMFQAGLSFYRSANYEQALATFKSYAGNVSELEERARGNFWIAKSYQLLGNISSAQTTFEITANLDPTGYYSERARDILLDRQPFEPPLIYDLGVDNVSEQKEAEAWMREKFGLSSDIDLHSPNVLLKDQRLIRGTALWKLGEYELARLEFEDLRDEVKDDPVNSYRLANYLLELGLYRSAIFAARQVLNLAGMNDAETMNAPIYFNHVRFGTYYKNIIIPVAQAYDFHPLFLFSVIRQESLFEGFVHSSAGARGLMQIVPSTGATVALQADWPPDYSDEDLYRPKVNITLGADYLDSQRDYFNGDLFVALAAYNGGPGNAAVWESLSLEDPDLFVEIIRFDETRRYIRGIYEVFNIYRRLYERTP